MFVFVIRIPWREKYEKIRAGIYYYDVSIARRDKRKRKDGRRAKLAA